ICIQLPQRSVPGIRDMVIDEFRQPRIANAGAFGYFLPFALALDQNFYKMGFKVMFSHPHTIAKLCYSLKQHFADGLADTHRMERKSINDVLAENLAAFMQERKLTQAGLGKAAEIGQTTVSLYLNPSR